VHAEDSYGDFRGVTCKEDLHQFFSKARASSPFPIETFEQTNNICLKNDGSWQACEAPKSNCLAQMRMIMIKFKPSLIKLVNRQFKWEEKDFNYDIYGCSALQLAMGIPDFLIGDADV
jgi:hypothetical protein